MKAIYLFFIFNLLIQISTSAQSCLPEGITILTQQEIDDFQTNYPGCTVIEGDVWIHGYDINNLNGLSVLTEIGGNLNIDSTHLSSLQGLNSLAMINGCIQLFSNNLLDNLIGLDALTQIVGPIYFSFSGIENFLGMSQISSIGGLELYWTGITSLSGLEGLTSINGNLNLIHCYLLDSLSGLENVKSINGFLQISLSAVKSLSGLDSINPNSINNLTITSNPNLSECDVESICSYLADPNGSIHIGANDTGCNNQEEILEACFSNTSEAPELDSIITFYPNPARNLLFFHNNSNKPITEITVYNQYGQIVLHEIGLIDKLDISEFPQGIYFIHFQLNGITYTEKIFKI
jgi:hypothetical protein